jgi:CRISPR system Cascade subunit CasE
MIYLSQLVLNPKDPGVRRDLTDVHDMHRTIMRAFPQVDDKAARERCGVLFRIDVRRDGTPTVLVQSTERPDWSPHTPTYLQTDPLTKRVDESFAILDTGRTLLFRLRANPTRRLLIRDGPDRERWNGKRVDIRGEAEQLEWLRRKGRDSGFELVEVRAHEGVPAVDARSSGAVTGRRRDSERKKKISFGSVLFEGILRVTDAAQFRQTLENGLGSGKAYGFGLLSVGSPRE